MSGLRVLVVDDDHDNADSLTRLVGRTGAEVRCAYDGCAALEIAHDFVPDLALLDLGMPTINGFRVAKHLRASSALRNTRLVAISGFGDPTHRALAHDVGFDEFVVKPYAPTDIDGVLQRTIEQIARTRKTIEQSKDLREACAMLREATSDLHDQVHETLEKSRALLRQPTFTIKVGKTYWVQWAGENFKVKIRGHGVNRPDHWVGSRLDSNKPVVLPAEAFCGLVE